MSTALTTLSARDMRRGLLEREFSALELTEAHLARILETNDTFNSFITISADEARAQAKRADNCLQEQGEQSPLLTGIPIALKDSLVTKNIETTCASNMLRGFIPPYDGTVVSRLLENGAVVLGKTNMDEFAMGSSNENSAFGEVKNPWDLERVPGGSSGGSAVAVATGQAPLALGSDTGGSIRQPASLCGVLGLKPTYGIVSRYGLVAFASSLDQIGPFGRSTYDLAVLLQAIAGHDERDSTSMNVEIPNYCSQIEEKVADGIQGLRIGIPREYFAEGLDSQVEASVRNAISRLEQLGAEIVEISLPHTDLALAAYYIIAPAEASSNLARYDGVRYGNRAVGIKTLSDLYGRTRAEGFGAEVKRRILIGTYVLSAGYYDAYYRKAQEVRTLIINDFKAAFTNDCDFIAAPVSPFTAFARGERTTSPLDMYLADAATIPTSLAGLPALSLPCGVDDKKLPIGLQLIGYPFSEGKLLGIAELLSQQLGMNSAAQTATDFAASTKV